MKKLFLSLSVLASLLVAGCSSDDAGSVDETDGNFTTHYMSVNIVSADGGQSRAAEYEDGTKVENKVSKIRFYFFTENGAAANVKLLGSTYVNYYDWTPLNEQTWTSTDSNVESKISATIVINTQAGDQLPRTIVAIVNPTADLTGEGLTTLRSKDNDYAQESLTKEGKFVMANSVYGNGNPVKEVCPVYITNDNICEKEGDAKNNPVTIYVERNVAKVEVSLGLSSEDYSDNKLKLKDKDGNYITVKEGSSTQQVYLKLGGWALTAETNKGNLIKRINPLWETTWWNEGANRCTWAINSQTALNRWSPKYSTINKSFGEDCQYTNENAAPFSDGNGNTNTLAKTKFIVKGELCDESGNALTVVRHSGERFVDTYSDTESSNLPSLKASILSYLEASGYSYWKDNSGGRTKIEATDIEIEPNATLTKEQSDHNCYVHAKLTTDATTKTWYTSETGTETKTTTEINTDLGDKTKIGEALVWKSGQTYYYKEIIHRNDDPSTPPTPGVVRNHWYKVNIKAITGLGTPVYNPGDIIYPEKPEEDDHYIAAAIDILSWRIVSYDYTLDW